MPRIKKPDEGIISWDDQLNQDEPEEDFDSLETCKELITLLKAKPRDLLLDVGCGAGLLLAEASRQGLIVTGIEATPEAAAISQKAAPQAQVAVASAADIPFKSNSFDLLTCLGFVNFFTTPAEGFREIKRVLKPGGRACLILPNAECLDLKKQEKEEFGEVACFTVKHWGKMIEKSGLKVLHFKPDLWSVEYVYERNENWFKWAYNWGARIFWRWFPKKSVYQFIFLCAKAE